MYYLNDYQDESVSTRGSNSNLFDVEEAFIKGNIEKNSYYTYRGFEPKKMEVKNERETLMYKISMYDFYAHEINLYLDLNPNDKQMYSKLLKALKERNKYINEYSQKYGPLVNDYLEADSYKYLNSPWPFEVMKNV